MRFLFVDEAGTSGGPREPVAVVCAVIVHADTQTASVQERIDEIKSKIPLPFRQKYPVFHAKKIWNSKDFRDEWSLEQRKSLLMEMMSCPHDLKLALAFGAVHQDLEIPDDCWNPVTKVQVRHGLALQHCLWKADQWIKQFCAANEVATVIAEDVPDMKEQLNFLVSHMKKDAAFRQMVEAGEFDPDGSREELLAENALRIERIRTPMYFASKIQEPFIQIADSCAFGIRRYLSGYSHGEDFMAAIGKNIMLDRWQQVDRRSAIMGSVFSFMPQTYLRF